MLINPELPCVHLAGLWQPVGHPKGVGQNLKETVVQFTHKEFKITQKGIYSLHPAYKMLTALLQTWELLGQGKDPLCEGKSAAGYGGGRS